MNKAIAVARPAKVSRAERIKQEVALHERKPVDPGGLFRPSTKYSFTGKVQKYWKARVLYPAASISFSGGISLAVMAPGIESLVLGA